MLSRRRFSVAVLAGLSVPAVTRLRAATPDEALRAATGLNQLHAILVQRGDDLIVSAAPRGAGLNRAANIKSCSKSMLALMLGAAIGRGAISGISARLGDVAPRLIPDDATRGVENLTMLDLVTLRAGLQSTSGALYGAWVGSPNWVSYALRQPQVSAAGGPMIYSTGTTHVLGAAIATATGQNLLTLARQGIGSGLGIEISPWPRDPQGFYFGGNDMGLTPRGMLRVAVAMRDGGRFDGRQVIPAEWVQASQVAQTRSPFSGLGYGYGWFISPTGWTLARGYGGQIIASHPGRGLAVAITSDPTLPARSEGYFGDLMRLLDGPLLALG